MKDTGLPVRAAYNTFLTGLGYNCYDYQAPDSAQVPYIILGAQTSQEQNTKNKFGHIVSINLIFTNSFIDQFGGRKALDQMVNTVLASLKPNPGEVGILISGFSIYGTNVIMSFDFPPEQEKTQTIYRRVVTIEHLLEQQ